MARFIHADDASEVIFLRGTTEAINLVASGLGDFELLLTTATRVVTTVVMEHHFEHRPCGTC